MLNEEDFKKQISTAIRKLRYEKKYSIEKLAELSETDYSSVNLIANGKQSPRSYTLYKIFHALGYNLLKDLNPKNQTRQDLEDNLLSSIAHLNEKELQDLIVFLKNFTLKQR